MNITKVTSNSNQRQTNFGINPEQAKSLKALSVRIAKLPETDAALGRIITECQQAWDFPKIEADPSKPRAFLIRQFNLLFDQKENLSQQHATDYWSYSDLFSERFGKMVTSVNAMESAIYRRKFFA